MNSMIDKLIRPESPTRKIIQRRKLTKLKDITNTIHNNQNNTQSVPTTNSSKLHFTFYNENKENQGPNMAPPQIKSYQPSPFNKLKSNNKILITSKSPSIPDQGSICLPPPIMSSHNGS